MRVIGLGQRSAGDDGVGLLVAARVAELSSAEVHFAPEASALIDLLESDGPVILVDAVVGAGAPGTVVEIDEGAIDHGPVAVSSHALGVRQAIALARELLGPRAAPEVHVVGIAIDRPTRLEEGLSPAVAAAVDTAARRVVERIEGTCTNRS